MNKDETGEVKRSVTIAGHRTSISLEQPFWDALKELACSRKTSVNDLVRSIDMARDGKRSLSSAIRLHILADLRAKLAGSTACAAGEEISRPAHEE